MNRKIAWPTFIVISPRKNCRWFLAPTHVPTSAEVPIASFDRFVGAVNASSVWPNATVVRVANDTTIDFASEVVLTRTVVVGRGAGSRDGRTYR